MSLSFVSNNQNMDNCVQTVSNILDQLNVKSTRRYVEDKVLSHPDHPSLLAIIDTLEKYNIQTLAVKVNYKKLNDLPPPFVVQVKRDKNFLFYVIEHIDSKYIKFRDEFNHKSKIAKEHFLSIWTGVCLLYEASADSKEEGIKQKLALKRFNFFLIGTLSFLFFIWAVLGIINSGLVITQKTPFFMIGYFLLKLVGLVVGVMLLWYEVDQFNPVLQKICTDVSNKKLNCNAVLNSKYAKFLGGSISLSLLSFSYFFGTLFFILINGFTESSISLLGLLSFLSLPIIILSLFSQAFIIRQWCKFCVAVQVILITECLLIFFGELYSFSVFNKLLPSLLFLLILPIALWNPFKRLLSKEKEVNLFKRGLAKIKNNKEVFWSLLHQSRKIKNRTQGLGITLKNPKAKHKVIKVCNPYCEPCAQAHPILEELYESNRISIQILFIVKESEDYIGKTVAHFLALDNKGSDQNKIKHCLHEWYNLKQKDFEQFASKHPINGESENQKDKIKRMREWCDLEEVQFTPTLFIDGYALPNEYSIADLKVVLG
jgi:uncharacterized membrane protein